MKPINTPYNLMGLGLTMKRINGPLGNLRFVIVGLVADFVIPPLFAFILIRIFSLEESLAIGLLLVSLAADAPGLSKLAEFAKQDSAAAMGFDYPPIQAVIRQDAFGQDWKPEYPKTD